MKTNDKKIVLKGRHNLAQGKRRRSVALGWKEKKGNRPRVVVDRRGDLFADETEEVFFINVRQLNSVRKDFISLTQRIFADGIRHAFFS